MEMTSIIQNSLESESSINDFPNLQYLELELIKRLHPTPYLNQQISGTERTSQIEVPNNDHDEVFIYIGGYKYDFENNKDRVVYSQDTFQQFDFKTGEHSVGTDGYDCIDKSRDIDECHCIIETDCIPSTVHEVAANLNSESESTDFTTNDYCAIRPRQSGNLRLWEFILHLLRSSKYNPSHIKWINRKKGEFKIIKPPAVAEMWGQIKNNDRMTYEKMSRAMRYYYKRRILAPVLNTRLVYKFAENAHGF